MTLVFLPTACPPAHPGSTVHSLQGAPENEKRHRPPATGIHRGMNPPRQVLAQEPAPAKAIDGSGGLDIGPRACSPVR